MPTLPIEDRAKIVRDFASSLDVATTINFKILSASGSSAPFLEIHGDPGIIKVAKINNLARQHGILPDIRGVK